MLCHAKNPNGWRQGKKIISKVAIEVRVQTQASDKCVTCPTTCSDGLSACTVLAVHHDTTTHILMHSPCDVPPPDHIDNSHHTTTPFSTYHLSPDVCGEDLRLLQLTGGTCSWTRSWFAPSQFVGLRQAARGKLAGSGLSTVGMPGMKYDVLTTHSPKKVRRLVLTTLSAWPISTSLLITPLF